jgi:hypothetical protein
MLISTWCIVLNPQHTFLFFFCLLIVLFMFVHVCLFQCIHKSYLPLTSCVQPCYCVEWEPDHRMLGMVRIRYLASVLTISFIEFDIFHFFYPRWCYTMPWMRGSVTHFIFAFIHRMYHFIFLLGLFCFMPVSIFLFELSYDLSWSDLCLYIFKIGSIPQWTFRLFCSIMRCFFFASPQDVCVIMHLLMSSNHRGRPHYPDEPMDSFLPLECQYVVESPIISSWSCIIHYRTNCTLSTEISLVIVVLAINKLYITRPCSRLLIYTIHRDGLSRTERVECDEFS